MYDDLDRLATKGSLTSATTRRTSTTVAGQAAVVFGYNNADQLTSVTKGSSTISLGYDGAGRMGRVTSSG
jgi:YD repeat-containing protein